MALRRIAVISDYCTRVPPAPPQVSRHDKSPPLRIGPDVPVAGGYLERLPLAVVQSGLADAAEVWNFTGQDDHPTGLTLSPHGLGERRFRADGHAAPHGSVEMLNHIRAVGAPEILCVWGLGVTEEVLFACPESVILYNSLDVDALRIPYEVSRHIDIFLTASLAQTAEVPARHPEALVEMLPVGPDFASPVSFFPLPESKLFDVIYVAAAQPYKRHDILFEALSRMTRSIRGLCVMGYGENAEALQTQAAELGLDMTFVGPPGVSHAEVNRLMNRARIGVVCGVNDGAPAILTEYMLAGLPVLANGDLACGLQYIRPDTGRTARADQFAEVLMQMLENPTKLAPRDVVLRNWTWPHSMARLAPLLEQAKWRRLMRCPA